MGRSRQTYHHAPPGIQTFWSDAYGVSTRASSQAPHSSKNTDSIEPNVQPIEHDQSDPQIDRDEPSISRTVIATA
jgi:hypothetical protein